MASWTYVSNLRNKRVVRVGIREHRADREENYGRHGEKEEERGEGQRCLLRTRSSEGCIERTKRTLRDGQSRRPLVPEDIQANGSIRVDVGVVDLGGESNLGGLEGVVCRKGATSARAKRMRRRSSSRSGGPRAERVERGPNRWGRKVDCTGQERRDKVREKRGGKSVEKRSRLHKAGEGVRTGRRHRRRRESHPGKARQTETESA